MPTNVFFNHAVNTEQHLYEDLVVESLRMYGHETYYLPRQIIEEDTILNEDVQSKFGDAYSVEMYIENLKTNKNQLRHDLSQKLKSQLRKVPELNFYLDESLDYIDKIDKELTNGENPLKKLSSLEPRQKR